MFNNYQNIRMFRNVGRLCRFRKMCKLTYYVVALDSFDYDTDFAVFSDELAARMFAESINSKVDYDWHTVSIPRK